MAKMNITTELTPPSNIAPRSIGSLGILLMCGGLVAAIFALFGRVGECEFVAHDDDVYVYINPVVSRGLTAEGFAWAFTHRHAGNWHPLSWLSHMVDCQLYGLAPCGHHLTNVGLHAAVAVFLFLVLRAATGATLRSLLVAALFALHPLRVESVAWVAERKDVLSGLFFMLTIGAYGWYAQGPRSLRRYAVVASLFILGLLAKPMLVTLPLVLLLLDYWPLGRFSAAAKESGDRPLSQWSVARRLILEKLPLLGLVAISCAVTVWAQSPAIQAGEQVPLTLRLANVPVAYVTYLGQLFYPVDLAILYPFPAAGISAEKTAAATLLLLAITGGCWVCRKRYPYFIVGWLWYLVMLLPTIGLLQVGLQARADRYTYLPQIGLLLMLVWGTADLTASWSCRRWLRPLVSGLVLAALAAVTFIQIGYWQNTEVLWNRALACTSDNLLAHYNLAVFLADRGKVDAAMEQYRQALKIDPRYLPARNNLGSLYDRQGSPAEAIQQYRLALQLQPDEPVSHCNLGLALCRQGNPGEALPHFQQALAANPQCAEAHYGLGMVLDRGGQSAAAAAQFQQALDIRPTYPDAHNFLGVVLSKLGKTTEAIAQFRQAVQCKPDYAQALHNLGSLLRQQGNIDEALECYRRALEIDPRYASAHINLGLALYQQQRYAEALAHWREALRLQPDQIPVLNQIAWALATCPDDAVRDGKTAVTLAQQALQLAGTPEPLLLDSLAAAHAEAGQFAEAISTAEQARQKASNQGRTALVHSLDGRLKLYRAGVPFRRSGLPDEE
jgi:tetratricopeptide (TPR) repeat protein